MGFYQNYIVIFEFCQIKNAFFVLLVVQADPSVSLSPMLEKEQQALYSTIQGFVGNWWNGSDLYSDPCGWTPIQNPWNFDQTLVSLGEFQNLLATLKKLQSLVLLENGLQGKLPNQIGNLVNLRRLVLAGNNLSGRIPASLGRLTMLLILDAGRNQLSGSLPVTLGSLTSLLKLDLSNNMIKGKLPVELGRLKNLTLLDLGSNKISGWLVQSNNPIGGSLIRIQWQNLHKLEILDLSSSYLRGHIPKSMTEMKRLRFLGLNNNKLSGTISPRLESLPCIGALYHYGNNFTGEVKFSEGFYQKMGRRFGAWNNPNLCY
ncbi:hypothetical protein ACLB2K_052000 [Fragaria x ananassa]